MDTLDFAKDFFAAFEAHITGYNISVDSGHNPIVYPNGMITSYMGAPICTVNIQCHLAAYPNGHLMEHFGLGNFTEHGLTEVRTNSNVGPTGAVSHQVDLTYKTTDFNKFTQAIKNLAYTRYSAKFHKQLDDILD